MDFRFFWLRDIQQQWKIEFSYVATELQLADIFTKPLAAPRFTKLRDCLNIAELS